MSFIRCHPGVSGEHTHRASLAQRQACGAFSGHAIFWLLPAFLYGSAVFGIRAYLMGAEQVQTMQSLLMENSRPTFSAPNSQQAWSTGSDKGMRARQQTVPCEHTAAA